MQLPQLSKDAKERLQALTQVTENLDIGDVSFSSYSTSINQLSLEFFSLQRSLNRLRFLEDELQDHLASTRHEEHLIDKWTANMMEEEQDKETTEMQTRRREALLKKAKEYHKELITVMETMPDTPPVTVTQLMEQQKSNKTREEQLKAKRAKIKAFKGLPSNLELARHELRNATNEQMELIQLRERLLKRMAESVS